MTGEWLITLTYAALAVFVIVTAYRTWKTARMPVHLRWELAPVPREKGKSAYGGSYYEEYEWWTKKREVSRTGELFFMLREILFLKGVWERNRRLWLFSFTLHAGIYLLLLMVCLLCADLALVPRRSVDEALQAAAFALAIAGYAIGVFGSAGLFVKRLVDPALEPFTTSAARFNLLFLAAMFASGGAACLLSGDYTGGMQIFLLGIFTADGGFSLHPALSAHIAIAALFAAYLPFTFMLHFIAKYFTYHAVRWNDEPMNEAMAKKMAAQLGRKLSWSAPHIRGGGNKTWADAAHEVTGHEKKP
jgi:nitrate reductase gamma subunit